MYCKSCQSDNQNLFPSEICIHFPGWKNLTTPTVMVFAQISICLDCGFTEFLVPETELRRLAEASEESAEESAAA